MVFATLVVNPRTGKAFDDVTLRLRFPEELCQAKAKVSLILGTSLLGKAKAGDNGAHPNKNVSLRRPQISDHRRLIEIGRRTYVVKAYTSHSAAQSGRASGHWPALQLRFR